jgi:hypothetical protein
VDLIILLQSRTLGWQKLKLYNTHF